MGSIIGPVMGYLFIILACGFSFWLIRKSGEFVEKETKRKKSEKNSSQ